MIEILQNTNQLSWDIFYLLDSYNRHLLRKTIIIGLFVTIIFHQTIDKSHYEESYLRIASLANPMGVILSEGTLLATRGFLTLLYIHNPCIIYCGLLHE